MTRSSPVSVLVYLAWALPVLAAGRVENATLEKFWEWFNRRGGRAEKVSIVDAGESGLGLLASAEIKEDEEILSIPLTSVLCRASVLKNSDSSLPEAVLGALVRVEDDVDLLSLLLLRERALASRSAWAPYLDLLPQRALALPSALPEDAARTLLGPAARARALTARSRLRERHARLGDALQTVVASVDDTRTLTSLDAFRWADSLVGSRALTLARLGRFLAPLADLLNHEPHPRPRAEAAGAFFERHHRLVDGRLVVSADRVTTAGNEVVEDYGDGGAELYFHSFGFVPRAPGPFDCVTVVLPRPRTGSERSRLVQQLRVKERPEVCLRPGQLDVPNPILYHLHMLSMSESAAKKCREEVAHNPKQGAVHCFGSHLGYSAESALTLLRTILESQLSRQPVKRRSAVQTHGDDVLAPCSQQLEALCHRFEKQQRELLQQIVQGLPQGGFAGPGPAATAQEPALEADKAAELEQLLVESTKSYLLALRSVRQTHNNQWSPHAEALLQELQGELSGLLAEGRPAPASRPSSSDSIISSRLALFNSWFERELGAERPLRVRAVEVADMRIGVQAQESIAKGEVYLVVPKHLIMDRHSAATSEIGSALDEVKQIFGRGDSFHELLMHLLYERFVMKERSRWWPYLQLLPSREELMAPYLAEDSLLEEALQVSALLPQIRQQRRDLPSKHTHIMQTILKRVDLFGRVPKHVFDLGNYEWATLILNSRSIWWDGERHLVPMLDFVNCRALSSDGTTTLPVHRTVSDSAGAAITKSPANFAQGEQIFENYGQPNHVYFLYHGFSLQENPHDCLLLDKTAFKKADTKTDSSTCLDSRTLDDEQLALSIAGGAAAVEAKDVAREEAVQRGRGLLLAELNQQQQQHATREHGLGDGGLRSRSLNAFVAQERTLLGELVQRLERLLSSSSRRASSDEHPSHRSSLEEGLETCRAGQRC